MDNRGVEVRYADGYRQYTGTAISHFGSGVLTFVLPWLFRTSPGIGLLVRGLANHVKADAVALDAVIETDWSPYTFTMSWKLVRGGVPVEFKKGDPVCMMQPFPLDLLEQIDCSFEPFDAAPAELRQGFTISRTGARQTSLLRHKVSTRRSETTLRVAFRMDHLRAIRRIQRSSLGLRTARRSTSSHSRTEEAGACAPLRAIQLTDRPYS